jgi:hypothetical protein
MNYYNQLIVLASASVVLSSCSMLGNRKESTKLDLEGTPISQMRIIGAKNPGGSATKEEESEATTGGSNPSSVKYEASFVDPNESAKDYIQKNNINFDKIRDKNQFSQGMDRASLFFDLGARLRANPQILEVNEESTKNIPAYSAEKIEKIRSDLNCGANLQSFVIRGSATIDLDDTEIGLIMSEEEKEDFLDSSFDPATLSQVFFKHFSEEAKEVFFDSFDPRLNQVKVGIAHHVEACLSSEKGPKAYMSDFRDYFPIEAGNISASGDSVTLKFSRVVTKDEISSLPLNSDEVPTLDRVTFGVDDENKNEVRIDVFGNDTLHRKNIIASFKAEKINEEVPATDIHNPATETANGTTTREGSPASPAPKKTSLPKYIPSLFISDDPHNTSLIEPARNHSGSTYLAENKNAADSDSSYQNSPLVVATSPIMTDEEFNQIISNEPFFKVVQKPTPFSPIWFNPSIQGHAKHFYPKNRNIYAPGTKNLAYWNDEVYNMLSNPLKTTEQVSQICDQYKYSRDMTFNVTLIPTHNVEVLNYITLPNGAQKSYRSVMFDQLSLDVDEFLVEVEKDENNSSQELAEEMIPANASIEQVLSTRDKVIMSIFDAAMTPNPQAQKQTWNLKVCFAKNGSDSEQDYRAFWSSNVSASKYTYSRKVAIATPRENIWIENSFQEELDPGATLPKDFNPERTKPHSVFSLATNSSTHETHAIFGFKFPGEMEAETLMYYLNPNLLKFPNKVYKTFLEIKNSGAITRNEVWVRGGFKMDFKAAAHSSAQYISPKALFKTNIVSTDIYPPILKTFPGDISELEFEIYPGDYDLPQYNVRPDEVPVS